MIVFRILIILSFFVPVIRASVPKLLLDDVFEQKNDIAKAVEEELEKVYYSLCVLVSF